MFWIANNACDIVRERSLITAGRELEGKLKIFNKISQPVRILPNGFVAQQ